MSIFTHSNYTFEGQLPDERVLLLTRRHWFTIAVPMVIAVFAVFIPFVLYVSFASSSWFAVFSSLFRFLTAVYLVFLWQFAFHALMLYQLNTVVVTNKRIIENEQFGFFNHRVNVIELQRIQDVSVHTLGVFATFLHFADLEVQSAGVQHKFRFPSLPRPETLKNIITKAKQGVNTTMPRKQS